MDISVGLILIATITGAVVEVEYTIRHLRAAYTSAKTFDREWGRQVGNVTEALTLQHHKDNDQ